VTGSCFDNALAESFFATIKKELIHLHVWATVKSVKSAIFDATFMASSSNASSNSCGVR